MKNLTFIGLLVVVVAVCLSLFWRHVAVARFDSDMRQHLAGIWLRQETGMSCTNTVEADGSFVELSWFSHPGRTNTYRRAGTWFVKDGSLVETVKTSTNPTEVTPHTLAGRIVRSDASGFAVRWPNSAETVWQRVVQ